MCLGMYGVIIQVVLQSQICNKESAIFATYTFYKYGFHVDNIVRLANYCSANVGNICMHNPIKFHVCCYHSFYTEGVEKYEQITYSGPC